MTTPTYAQYKAISAAVASLPSETLQERLLTLFSVLASGQNPDGTAAPGGSGTSGQTFRAGLMLGTDDLINGLAVSGALTANGGGNPLVQVALTLPLLSIPPGGQVAQLFATPPNFSAGTCQVDSALLSVTNADGTEKAVGFQGGPVSLTSGGQIAVDMSGTVFDVVGTDLTVRGTPHFDVISTAGGLFTVTAQIQISASGLAP